jgi:hypothetical protein
MSAVAPAPAGPWMVISAPFHGRSVVLRFRVAITDRVVARDVELMTRMGQPPAAATLRRMARAWCRDHAAQLRDAWAIARGRQPTRGFYGGYVEGQLGEMG